MFFALLLVSHLHKNISTRFLTCDPYLAPHSQSSPYMDEADVFYQHPLLWLNQQYRGSNPYEQSVNDITTSNVNNDVHGFENSSSFDTRDGEVMSEKQTELTKPKVPNLSYGIQNIPPSAVHIKRSLPLPRVVVCFDVLVPRIEGWLKDRGYVLERTIYHTTVPLESRIGQYVMLYSRCII